MQGPNSKAVGKQLELVIEYGRKEEEAFSAVKHLIAAMCSPQEYKNNKTYSQKCNLVNRLDTKRSFHHMHDTVIEDWMSPERYAQVMVIIENNLKVPENENEALVFPCAEGDQKYTRTSRTTPGDETRVGNEKTNMMQGWSEEGITRYLELCKNEVADRRQYGRKFSEDDKHKRCDYLSYPEETDNNNNATRKTSAQAENSVEAARDVYDFDDDDEDEDGSGVTTTGISDERIQQLLKDGMNVELI